MRSSQAKTWPRTLALMRLRSGTSCASFRLADAAAIAVIGHEIPAAVVFDFLQQVGAAEDGAAAQARHAVNLREGAQQDHVFPAFTRSITETASEK